ncbi:hypothetical protein EDE12_1114 [Methylosinus sp. sav-2]|jgi:hypothetical protein|nr:hypothetical protein EDE12_1114 [Methylosinus sp. sav-2]
MTRKDSRLKLGGCVANFVYGSDTCGSHCEGIELLRCTQFATGLQLVLSDHMHEFYPRECRGSRSKGFETQHRPRHSLHRSMVLFDNIIEVFDAADLDVRLMLLVIDFVILGGKPAGPVR